MTSVLTMKLLELTGQIPGSPPGVVPFIDGRSLIDLLAEFKSRKGWNPAVDHGGLVPEYFNYGDLSLHYLGRSLNQWPRPGVAWLLGCSCGEVGCDPFEAQIDVDDDHVTWSSFTRDLSSVSKYTGFGPFVFDRAQYEAAVRAVVEEVAQQGPDLLPAEG